MGWGMTDSRLIVVTAAPGAGDPLPAAAALALAMGRGVRSGHSSAQPAGDAVVADPCANGSLRGGLLASGGAQALASQFAAAPAGIEAVSRGRLCFCVPREPMPPGREGVERRLAWCAEVYAGATGAPLVLKLGAGDLAPFVGHFGSDVNAVLLQAREESSRALLGMLVGELGASGQRLRIWRRQPGRLQARRALGGLEPGGGLGERATNFARLLEPGEGGVRPRPRASRRRQLEPEAGQALPLAIGVACLGLLLAAFLVALGGGAAAKGRAQRATDLAALSAARSMREDFPRLFIPALRGDGSPDPRHLERSEYLRNAEDVGVEVGAANGLPQDALRVSFPDGESFAPLEVRVSARPAFSVGGSSDGPHERRLRVVATAALAQPAAGPEVGAARAQMASGGGYSGPLAYRQGKPMRPDVAAGFDRMSRAAAAAGLSLRVNSAFRSDAEQARLFAANPDPRWVARPGTSLHRCGTELDLGPPGAYGWLAANASRFGFLQRYSWEAWHFGYVRGPDPCSTAADRAAGSSSDSRVRGGDGRDAGGSGLPGFVPAAYRGVLLREAARHDLSAALLAAQLMAESNFNPAAVSAAGAQGIAQFVPSTAAAYGLRDPFDAEQAIAAQARLMADLLGQFGSTELALAAYNAGPGAVSSCSCVPPYPETRAYVARIMALLDGAGELAAPAPALLVRLIS